MSKATSSGRKPLAFVTALMVVLALAIPFAGAAVASHGPQTHDLNCEPETAQNQTNTTHEIFCEASNLAPGETVEVDFELTGPNDPDGTNSPTSPDITEGCQEGTTEGGNTDTNPFGAATAGECVFFISYTGANTGTDTIRAWIDDDTNNTTFDADAGEQQDETTVAGRGDITEVDDTDVVTKTWFGQIPAGAALDCDDEQGTVETGTASSTGSDIQTNPAGQAETYTCRVTQNDGGDADTERDPVSGVVIDVEQEGANDPDNRNFGIGANTTPDRNDACTTDAQGRCTIVIPAQDNELGNATICFWADLDNDNQFANGGADIDGGQCGEAFNAPENDNVTDVAQKEWATAAAAQLDAEPEVDNNASGTQHTVTATVLDQFGNPVSGQPVDFTITGGRNVLLGNVCNNVATNANGVATCTYTDSGTSTTSGQDTIQVTREGSAVDATEGRNEATAAGTTAEPDLTDVVTKFWTAGGPPAAGTVIVDMNPANGCADTADSTDSQVVGSENPICGVVRAANGTAIPGKTVTLTYDGPGEFGRDRNNNGTLDAGEGQGDSITVTADENGRFDATLFSTQTGTGTVTATADNASDTGTKTWTTPAAGARNIDCEPDTATNTPGTDHVWTCTVTDRFGNPVANVSVTPSETGPGRLQNTGAQTTDANGQVEFVTSSTVNEEGDQSLTGQLTSDVADNDNASDLDDACDQPAGTTLAAEPGTAGGTNQDPAPAGNCEDTIVKTWGDVTPPAECNDGIDNDGDGRIDFPADPGCESAADDDESDFPDQDFGGTTGDPVTEGACTGFLTGSVQADPDGDGLVIVGTNGPDSLVGSDNGDLICALDDDDAVQGLGGNDTIFGGGGKDAIEAGLGDDSVFGEGDKDVILGDDGNDEIDGGQGNDNMSGGGGADVLLGRGGWDTLKGNAGDDLLVGARGNDILQGGGGNDTARGGAGDDVLKGYTGNDTLRGGGGDDIIRGGAGRDRLFGNAGNDIINGGPGRDRCRGGRGRDILRNCP